MTLNFIMLLEDNYDGALYLHSVETLLAHRIPYSDIPVDEITVYKPRQQMWSKSTFPPMRFIDHPSIQDIIRSVNEYSLHEDEYHHIIKWRELHTACIIRFRDSNNILDLFDLNGHLGLIKDSSYQDKQGNIYQGIIL